MFRMEAADVAGKLGSDFNASVFFDELNETIDRRAKQKYDEFMKELVLVFTHLLVNPPFSSLCRPLPERKERAKVKEVKTRVSSAALQRRQAQRMIVNP